MDTVLTFTRANEIKNIPKAHFLAVWSWLYVKMPSTSSESREASLELMGTGPFRLTYVSIIAFTIQL